MRKFEGFQKGVNLGGWISQFRKYDKAHFDSYITEEDIRNIKEFGFDHVRCPVDYIVLEDEAGNVREDGFAYLEMCRQWCEKFGLNMIIDLHECYGYSFDPLKKDDKKQFFYNEKDQERFLKLWEQIAVRFAKYSSSVAFEPLNEVVMYEVADAWNKLLCKYVERMRALAPDTYLVIGGVCYNSVGTIALLDFPLDDHIVYNFHCYEPMVFTHQGAYWVPGMPSDFRTKYPASPDTYVEAAKTLPGNLAGTLLEEPYCNMESIGPEFFETLFKPALDTAAERDIPLYCGEYGVIDLADNESKLNWSRDICSVFDKYGIGRAYWNYKEKDYGIVNIEDVEVQKELGKLL
jgi:aryl-phospho-beta-D-glucosidase BglC (GH1 family)